MNNKINHENEINYCLSNFNTKVTIKNDEKIITKEIGLGTSTFFDLDSESKKILRCNNGSKITYNDGKINISNIYLDTICTFYDSINNAIEDSDDTENYIILLSNVSVSERIFIPTNMTIDINGKNILGSVDISIFNTKKDGLTVSLIDNIGTGLIKNELMDVVGINSKNVIFNTSVNIDSKRSAIRLYKSAENSTINATSGIYNCEATDSDACIFISNQNETINISDVEVNSIIGIKNKGKVVLTNSIINTSGKGINNDGKIIIDNTKIKSKEEQAIYNVTGTNGSISINNSTIISSASNSSTIHNNGSSSSIINIKNSNVTHTYVSNENGGSWRQTAIRNELGTININGGKYVSEASSSIYNNDSGIINIKSAILSGTKIIDDFTTTILSGNNSTGTINICSATIESKNNQDLNLSSSLAHIYYKSGIKWGNGVIPSVYSNSNISNIILENSLICE